VGRSTGRFEERFVREAAEQYERLTADERDAVDRCLDHALVNPSRDGERIVELRIGALVASAILCDELSILFTVRGRTMWILSIERGVAHG
jgi:hypothetical protein